MELSGFEDYFLCNQCTLVSSMHGFKYSSNKNSKQVCVEAMCYMGIISIFVCGLLIEGSFSVFSVSGWSFIPVKQVMSLYC